MWRWCGSWESVRPMEGRSCIARHTYESGWLGNEDHKTERGAADKQYVLVTPKDVPGVSNSTHERSSRLGQRRDSQIVARKLYSGKVRRTQEVLYGSLFRSGRTIRVQ